MSYTEKKANQRAEQYAANATEEDISKIAGKLDGMNRGKVAKIWDKVLLLWDFIKDKNAPWAGKAMAIGALLYLISPIDIVPDIIPIAGLADDVGVILAVVAKLATDLAKYKKQNNANQ